MKNLVKRIADYLVKWQMMEINEDYMPEYTVFVAFNADCTKCKLVWPCDGASMMITKVREMDMSKVDMSKIYGIYDIWATENLDDKSFKEMCEEFAHDIKAAAGMD